MAAHVLILMVMALIVLHEPVDEERLIHSGFSTVDDTEFPQMTVAEFTLTPPAPDASPRQRMAVSTAAAGIQCSEPTIKLSRTGTVRIAGSIAGFKIGGNAVSKGNFTAWTVPEDPQPWKDYLVVIQIRLPDEVTKYRKEDLTGFLTGDDGYETPIGEFQGRGYAKKYYGEFDMAAKQFVIRIPGAAAKVQDTIEVKSKVLNEKQVLYIVF